MQAKNIKITGLVQGVFFRKTAWDKAQETGVKGWVKNCRDNSVEIHAEGRANQLIEFEKWCRRGPPQAMVESVTSKKAVVGNFETFDIRDDKRQ